MTKYKSILILFVLTLFLSALLPVPLSAQSAGDLTDDLTDTEDNEHEQLFLLRVVWSGGENALHFEIVFEKNEENETYISYSEDITNLQSFRASLPLGDYRVQVIPFDILGRPSEPSEWRNFQISPASIEEMESGFELELPLILPPPKEPEQNIFDNLESVMVSIGLAWSPSFMLYGENEDYTFLGFGMHFSVIFRLLQNIYFGPELTTSFFVYEDYTLTAGANLLTMLWLPGHRAAFGVRFGASYPLLPQSDEGFASENSILNLGVSFRYRAANRFFVEWGLDLSHMMSDPPSGNLSPLFGAGLQF